MIKLAFAVLASVAGIASVHAAAIPPSGIARVPAPFDSLVTISQTDDQTPVAGDSVACGSQSDPHLYTRENHYWRRFYFDEYPDVGLYVRFLSVDVGVDSTNGLNIEVRLYLTPHTVPVDTIDRSQLVFIGSGDVDVPADTALTTVNVPVNASLAGSDVSDLVVEVFTPDGSVDSHWFYIGATTAPETHTSFYSSIYCDIGEPLPVGDPAVGAPDMHLVMSVNTAGDALFADGFDGTP
jgi:hypothetical protein